MLWFIFIFFCGSVAYIGSKVFLKRSQLKNCSQLELSLLCVKDLYERLEILFGRGSISHKEFLNLKSYLDDERPCLEMLAHEYTQDFIPSIQKGLSVNQTREIIDLYYNNVWPLVLSAFLKQNTIVDQIRMKMDKVS